MVAFHQGPHLFLLIIASVCLSVCLSVCVSNLWLEMLEINSTLNSDKNKHFIDIINLIMAGRTEMAGGPHAARGPRVEDQGSSGNRETLINATPQQKDEKIIIQSTRCETKNSLGISSSSGQHISFYF